MPEQPARAEVEQVRGADVLDDREQRGRRQQQATEPERRTENVDEPAAGNAHRRHDSGAAALADALGHDVEDGRARDDDQRGSREAEDPDCRGVGHAPIISPIGT